MNAGIFALPGAGFDASLWTLLRVSLAPHGIAVAAHDLDLSEAESVAGLAENLELYIPPGSVLIGHSLGAAVALEIAAERDDLGGLVLIGAAAAMPVNPQLLSMAAADPPGAATMLRRYGLPKESRAGQRVAAMQSGPALAGLGLGLALCDGWASGPRSAARVSCPTLVVSGGHDRLTKPESGEALAGMIGESTFEVMADCGHFPMLEDPDALAAILAKYF